jgi:hypothetical protein
MMDDFGNPYPKAVKSIKSAKADELHDEPHGQSQPDARLAKSSTWSIADVDFLK